MVPSNLSLDRWGKSELHELSRRGQSEVRQEKRSRAWREWTRDQRGTFGVKWLTKRTLIFIIFFFCVAWVQHTHTLRSFWGDNRSDANGQYRLGITLYFVIPRAPAFTFYISEPFTVDNTTVSFSRTPTNFSFTGNLNLLGESIDIKLAFVLAW
jgi:hypothetical protein